MSAITWSAPAAASWNRRSTTAPKPADFLVRFLIGHANAVYFGLIAGLTLFILAAVFAAGWSAGGRWLLLVVLLASALPASELAVGVVNYLVTLLLPPRDAAQAGFQGGHSGRLAPPSWSCRPCCCARKERRRCWNGWRSITWPIPIPQLRFALLTDFADAPAEHMPEDEAYVQAALDGVAALNARHARRRARRVSSSSIAAGSGTRRRAAGWAGNASAASSCEFNRLLRGARDTSYIVAERRA